MKRWFPLSVVIVTLIAGLEAWGSAELRINPACGAGRLYGTELAFLQTPLLILALPGWIGHIVLAPFTEPLRHCLPIDWADRFSLGSFYFAQMLAYFVGSHAVRRLILSLKGGRKRGAEIAAVQSSGRESPRDASP